MFKYKVKVPNPSAERLNHEKTFYIKKNYGCGGSFVVFKSIIPNDIDNFHFNLSNKFEFFDKNIIDADYDEAYIIFKNSTGSRTEKVNVLLEEI